jgi:predicted ester cyclase
VEHMNVFNVAFSDMQIMVLDIISDGEKVVARTTWRGTNDGEFMGMPSTGKQIEIEAFIVERLKDGKSVEHWSLFDKFTMMQHLGLLPKR